MFEDVLRAFGGEGTKHKRGSDSRKSENIEDLDDGQAFMIRGMSTNAAKVTL